MTTKTVLIIGGGIGGLVSALSLHRAGVSVKVFETVHDIKPLGVGINLLPHAVRVLTDLNLDEQLDQVGIQTADLRYYSKHGKEIWMEPRGKSAGYHWPQYSIHRGRFQLLLLEAVQKELGEEAVLTGHHLQAFDEDEKGVTSHFIDRKTGESLGSYKADFMIGADGIHSVVRRQFYPNEGLPNYSGRILWRGITESEPFLTGRSMIMAGYQDLKFVAYPISPEAAKRGRSLVNWIAELTVGGDAPPKSDWNKKVDQSVFASSFTEMDFDWLNVPELIDQAEAIYEFPLVDRDPLPQWSFGRVTLLGDAAHPMYPIGSNGASQAILDTEALALAIKSHDQLEVALKAYENERLAPTAAIVESNRKNGPEVVMQIVEDRAPNGFQNLDEVISHEERLEIANRYKQVAGFDREKLNQKKGESK